MSEINCKGCQLNLKAESMSVDELVVVLNSYTKLEERLVGLLLEVQDCNRKLRKVIVEKKSISVTG
jgi:hypothetical protein